MRLFNVCLAVALLLVAMACSPAHALHPRYHTYETALAELQAIAASYPEIAKLDSIGHSSDWNHGIWALKLSDNVETNEDEPSVLYNGVHHAEEVLGLEICLYMIDDLCSRYGVVDSVTEWIDETEIWFIPLLNPDGHRVVTDSIATGWRKNGRDNNGNEMFDTCCDGVDLNNNYDFVWSAGGSSDPSASYYRGPTPFSENETQIMRDICQSEDFVFSLNYHSPSISSGDVVYYPWMWSGSFAPDHPVISNVANNVAQRIRKDIGTFYAIWGGATAGRARNWQYGVNGTIGMTIEVLSYEVQPPGAEVDTICARNLPGAYYLLDRVVGPGITGTVNDLITGSPLEAEVRILQAYDEDLPARMTDPTFGRYRRVLMPGTYTVEVLKTGYQTIPIAAVSVADGPCVELNIVLAPSGVSAQEIQNTDPTPGAVLEFSPNPFVGSAQLSFELPGSRGARLEIFDSRGRFVRGFILADGVRDGAVVWDCLDSSGRPAASGIYFARLSYEDITVEAKAVLVR